MSKATISRESAIQGLLSLGVNVDWNSVNPDIFQKTVIEDPVETGRRFTDFLNNGCHVSVVVNPGVTPSIPEGKKWTEVDGVIYLSVTSNGRSGEEWIAHFEKNGIRLSKYSKDVLRSPDFKPTNGITYNLAVLRGTFFSDSNRITRKIRAEGDKRGWTKPEAEVGCLIRDLLSDEEIEQLGLWWIVAMHEPIKDSGRGPRLLYAYRNDGGHWLGACWGGPDNEWSDSGAFAFLVSQVQN